jgi:hypothetical protein
MNRSNLTIYDIFIFLLLSIVLSCIWIAPGLRPNVLDTNTHSNAESFILPTQLPHGMPHVIFLGDSVLNNSAFVPFDKTVKSQMFKYATVKSFAKNGAILADIPFQISQLPVHIDGPQTTIFISIGGNNLLNLHNTPNGMNKLIKQHSNLVDRVSIYMPTSRIVVFNVYNPLDKRYSVYLNTIREWNRKLKLCVYNAKNIEHADISAVMTHSTDFVHSIEPSAIGGKKLAMLMSSYI